MLTTNLGKSTLAKLKSVLMEEAGGLQKLADQLDFHFQYALDLLIHLKGRLITCGVGKSGHIARKAAGTFSSTGTLSFFLHADEALHGDLGMVAPGDLVLFYSYSGETDELIRLIPSLKAIGAKILLITGRPNCTLAKYAEISLDIKVREEVCPHNLAPTTSTTVMLALSDALALAVMEERGFTKENFAVYHPSGTLGKRLLLCVSDVMRSKQEAAIVKSKEPLMEIMATITRAGAGGACVVDGSLKLLGYISDGDLRRHFLESKTPLAACADEVMHLNPVTIRSDSLALEALEKFQNLPKKIGEMPVVDDSGKILGILLLKDLLRSGIV